MKWRAISTAPHDGRWLLLYDPDMEMPVSMGSYFHDRDGRTPRGHFISGRWYLAEWDGMPSMANPTHWAPLPDGPDERETK